MAEATFQEFVIPGTYVRVSAEGLIGGAAISTGNIGIVGTAEADAVDGETHIFSDYAAARGTMGDYDALTSESLNLTRGLEILYRNGGRTVFARAVAEGANQAQFTAAFQELIKDDVNILVAPELDTEAALAVLGPVLEAAENAGKDLIAVVGADGAGVSDILGQTPDNDRIVMVAPGIVGFDAEAEEPGPVDLPASYTAAAVAGLLSTLGPQVSPTNKALPGVTRLTQRFSYAETVQLVQGRVLVLEQRRGVRVVRGVTSQDGPFRQITTRRITDYAKGGMRAISSQFVGRLNNERVRKALQGALDGFLTTMLQNEQLTGYTLAVTATRDEEINGIARVSATLQPTFSIDYVAVTLVLE